MRRNQNDQKFRAKEDARAEKNYIYKNTKFCYMCILKEKQIRTLELLRRGKKPREIEKLAGCRYVHDAINRGVKNIDRAVETLRIAIEKNLMTKEQRVRAKRVLSKL